MQTRIHFALWSALSLIGLVIISSCGAGPTPGVERHDIVIVGAGAAGLSAGWFLHDQDILLLEKENRVGGRAISGRYRDFRYAKGAEYLGEPDAALEALIEGVGAMPVEIPYPGDARYRDGTFYYGDDGVALDYIERSSVADYNRFGATLQEALKGYRDVPHYQSTPEATRLDNMTAREWLKENGFGEIYQDITNSASRGLFGASIDEISAYSYLPEMGFDFLDAEPIEDIDDLSAEPNPDGDSTGAFTFIGGVAELTDLVGEKLSSKIRLNSKVIEVTSGGRWKKVVYIDAAGETKTIEAKVVILAVPAPIALAIAPSVLGDERRGILDQIPYSSYATLALFTDKPVFDRAFDLGMPDGMFFTDVYDGTWVEKHFRPELAAGKGCVMSLYIAPKSYKDHSLDAMPEEEILERSLADLEKIFPGVRQRIVDHDLQRFPYAYPVMTLGAYKRLDRLSEINSGTVILTGDYTMYPTIQHAIQAGYYAALKANRSARFPLSWLFD